MAWRQVRRGRLGPSACDWQGPSFPECLDVNVPLGDAFLLIQIAAGQRRRPETACNVINLYPLRIDNYRVHVVDVGDQAR